MAKRLRTANVPVTMEIWPQMIRARPAGTRIWSRPRRAQKRGRIHPPIFRDPTRIANDWTSTGGATTLFAYPTQQPIALRAPHSELAGELAPDRLWSELMEQTATLDSAENAALP